MHSHLVRITVKVEYKSALSVEVIAGARTEAGSALVLATVEVARLAKHLQNTF